MPNNSINRRDLIKAAAGAGFISASFAGFGSAVQAAESAAGGSGLFSVYALGAVKLHTYMAPSSSAVVTSHIADV